jgi:hypothetical protein
MTEGEGTYAQLVELAQKKDDTPKPSVRPGRKVGSSAAPEAKAVSGEPAEDLSTTPYISQNYRFTEDELRWLRRQAYSLTERLGAKVSQNTILRVALHQLRELCTKSPKSNPLLDTLTRIKK